MKKSAELYKLEERLQKRGMVQTMGGEVLYPPKRMFQTLGEEILWILNQEKLCLTVNELSRYLGKDKKTIGKVMIKLTSSSVNLVKKIKRSSAGFGYRSNFNKDLDIPTLYKSVRMAATKKIR
jgi:hypothetical protein